MKKLTEYKKQKLLKNTFLCFVVIIVCVFQMCSQHEEKTQDTVTLSGNKYAYVTFIDVGQGDSTLFKSPGGKFMLIDAGTTQAGTKICDYLENNGVEEIEYLILTHPHEDHIGSADLVVDSFDVKNVIMTDVEQPSSAYSSLVDSLVQSKNTKSTNIVKPEKADVYNFDGLSVQILSDGSAYDDINDTSIAVKVTYDQTSFIITGDAGTKVEKQIISDFANLKADVLKCGHHGSSTSNSKKFIQAVAPMFAVVSCELDNSYGHPHFETLKYLSDAGVAVYRTDYDGDIMFVSDGSNVQYCDVTDIKDVKVAA